MWLEDSWRLASLTRIYAPPFEHGQILHSVGKACVDLRGPFLASCLARLIQLIRDPRHDGIGVDCRKAFQQLLLWNPALRHRRHLQQNMEMIREHAIRQHSAALGSTRQPEKFSCIRMNIRKYSRSASPNTKHRSTTREMQW